MNEQAIMAQTGARLTGLIGELTVRNAEMEARINALMGELKKRDDQIKELEVRPKNFHETIKAEKTE